MYYLFKWVI